MTFTTPTSTLRLRRLRRDVGDGKSLLSLNHLRTASAWLTRL